MKNKETVSIGRLLPEHLEAPFSLLWSRKALQTFAMIIPGFVWKRERERSDHFSQAVISTHLQLCYQLANLEPSDQTTLGILHLYSLSDFKNKYLQSRQLWSSYLRVFSSIHKWSSFSKQSSTKEDISTHTIFYRTMTI